MSHGRLLFIYERADDGMLDDGWRILTTNPRVQVEDVPWDEYVEYDTGHRRDGTVIMY